MTGTPIGHGPEQHHQGSAAEPDRTNPASIVPIRPRASHKYVHVQVRPRHAAIAKCVAELNDLLDKHPDVTVDLVGVIKDGKHLALTLALDLGPADGIARHSAVSIAAFMFANDLFKTLFDYLPNYVEAPSEEVRRAAADLPVIIGTGRTQHPGLASAS